MDDTTHDDMGGGLRQKIVSKLSARRIAHTPLGDTEILNGGLIADALLPIVAAEKQRWEMTANIKMLENLKKSLAVAHTGGFINGQTPIQLPQDIAMQEALAAEFDRNIKDLQSKLAALDGVLGEQK